MARRSARLSPPVLLLRPRPLSFLPLSAVPAVRPPHLCSRCDDGNSFALDFDPGAEADVVLDCGRGAARSVGGVREGEGETRGGRGGRGEAELRMRPFGGEVLGQVGLENVELLLTR